MRELVALGDVDGAATVAIRAYGGEIFGFLLAIHPADDASDVFSAFSERLWRSLGKFAWQCPLRAWAYVIARNESRRALDGAKRRGKREAPLSPSAVSGVAAEVRSKTLSLYATENKTALAALRDGLPEDERMLLVLRMDRELEWIDLARVFHDGEAELEAEELKREAARLRKRFQLVKAKLLDLGTQRGLFRRSSGE
ncbi:MAG: sigma-70 family RNA polymerase sigma factor [Polyangiaceae bacterium]